MVKRKVNLGIITHGSSRGVKRRGDLIKYYWIVRLLRFARNDRLDYAKLSEEGLPCKPGQSRGQDLSEVL